MRFNQYDSTPVQLYIPFHQPMTSAPHFLTSDVFPRNLLISLMPDSRWALHRPFRSDVWILSQRWFASAFGSTGFARPFRRHLEGILVSGQVNACQNAFCVGSDEVWHGIAFACALTARDRDLHSVQFVGQFQHARRVRFLSREASGYDQRSSPPKKQAKIIPENWGPPNRRYRRGFNGVSKILWPFSQYTNLLETRGKKVSKLEKT